MRMKRTSPFCGVTLKVLHMARIAVKGIAWVEKFV